jgi:hypothetical protein
MPTGAVETTVLPIFDCIVAAQRDGDAGLRG